LEPGENRKVGLALIRAKGTGIYQRKTSEKNPRSPRIRSLGGRGDCSRGRRQDRRKPPYSPYGRSEKKGREKKITTKKKNRLPSKKRRTGSLPVPINFGDNLNSLRGAKENRKDPNLEEGEKLSPKRKDREEYAHGRIVRLKISWSAQREKAFKDVRESELGGGGGVGFGLSCLGK